MLLKGGTRTWELIIQPQWPMEYARYGFGPLGLGMAINLIIIKLALGRSALAFRSAIPSGFSTGRRLNHDDSKTPRFYHKVLLTSFGLITVPFRHQTLSLDSDRLTGNRLRGI